MTHCAIVGGDVHNMVLVVGWRGGSDWNSGRSDGGGGFG